MIDELSGLYYNDSIRETYTFYIYSYFDSSYKTSLLSISIEINNFNFSSVKLPIYLIYQKSETVHSVSTGRVSQYYKALNSSEEMTSIHSQNGSNVGFYFTTNKNINFNEFSDFKFKGSIYTGEYIYE